MPDKPLLSAFFPAHSEGGTFMSEDRSSLVMFYVPENWKVLVVVMIVGFLMMQLQEIL